MRVHVFLSFFVLAFFLISCTSRTSSALKEIVIDPAQNSGSYDLAADVEPEFDMLSLETTDNCLIGRINRIVYINDMYYVLSDNIVIHIFDREGKFISKLDKVGRAPGEYLNIRDFAVLGDNIWIYDNVTHKLACFDKEYNKTEDIQTNTVIETITIAGENLYAAGNWWGYDKENFQIIEYNIPTGKMEKRMPYAAPDAKYAKWLYAEQLASLADSALFTMLSCDTIFSLGNGVLTPRYKYRFTKPYTVDWMTFDEHKENRNAGKIIGIYGIYQTPASVVIPYHDEEGLWAVYDKETETTKMYSFWAVNSVLGNLKTPFTLYGKDLITFYTATMLMDYPEEFFDEDKIKNPADRRKIESVIAGLKEDSNPVVFRYRLKKDSRL